MPVIPFIGFRPKGEVLFFEEKYPKELPTPSPFGFTALLGQLRTFKELGHERLAEDDHVVEGGQVFWRSLHGTRPLYGGLKQSSLYP